MGLGTWGGSQWDSLGACVAFSVGPVLEAEPGEVLSPFSQARGLQAVWKGRPAETGTESPAQDNEPLLGLELSKCISFWAELLLLRCRAYSNLGRPRLQQLPLLQIHCF